MDRIVYKIQFARKLPTGTVDYHLITAVLAAESLHGRCAVRLDAVTRLNAKNRTVTIDAETQVGLDIARMFIGFLSREFGERSFQVNKTEEYLRETDREFLSEVLL